MTTEPLDFEFRVRCDPEHAFRTWTERTDAWWPKDHTSTGDPATLVVIERGEGGRIFERTPDGAENEWGEITVWDPPSRLSYSWHIASTRQDATTVDLTFMGDGDETVVRVVHHGWDRFGAGGEERREANHQGWNDLVTAFLDAA